MTEVDALRRIIGKAEARIAELERDLASAREANKRLAFDNYVGRPSSYNVQLAALLATCERIETNNQALKVENVLLADRHKRDDRIIAAVLEWAEWITGDFLTMHPGLYSRGMAGAARIVRHKIEEVRNTHGDT